MNKKYNFIEMDCSTAMKMMDLGYNVILRHNDSEGNLIAQRMFFIENDTSYGDLKETKVSLYDIKFGKWLVEVKTNDRQI